MPFPSPTFLDQIRGMLGVVAGEFEHFYAQLEGYLRKEHKDDGSHGDVTAESVVVAKDVTAGGAGTFGGDLTAWAGDPSRECALGTLPNDNPVIGSFGDCVGLKIGSREHVAGKPWFLLTQTSSFFPDRRELIFVDGNQSDSVGRVAAALYYVPGGVWGHYVFGPTGYTRHPGGLDLGYPSPDRLISNIYTRNIAAVNGVTERGRSVPMGEWQDYTPSWISSGTQPSVGTGGSVTGRYTLIGNTMHVRARVTLGTGFSFGTGTHGVNLPIIGALSPMTPPRQMLTARYVGTDTYVQVAYVLSISGVPIMPFITGTGPIAVVSSTSPFTFAAGDTLEIGGTLEWA